MRTKPKLPPELIDYIIDYLHDNIWDLRSCALVSKTWLPSCRFHIFYRISICSYGSSEICYHRLYEFIQQTPCLASYVRDLKFIDNPDAALERILLPLLRSFTQLCKLSLSNLDWDWFTPDMKKLFVDILDLPSLVHFKVKLVWFSRPEDFINLLRPPLKRLAVGISWSGNRTTVDIGSVVNAEGQDAMAKRRPCRLELLDLSIAFSPALIEWLLRPQSIVDLSNLRSLYVYLTPGPMVDEATEAQLGLMRGLGSSLEHITVYLSSERWVRHIFCNFPLPY
jgi:hypothetical protein